MPRSELIDPESNVILKYSICVPSILPGHCSAEVSYVDFECKPGYKMDGDTGYHMQHFKKNMKQLFIFYL